MKFKTFLAMYKNLIILIWWLIILIVFKVTTNFVFRNGNSLIFILLMVVIPLTLYIFGVVYKKQLIKQKKLRKGPYIEIIKNDYKNKKFNKDFLDKLNQYHFTTELTENNLDVFNDQFLISFTKTHAYLAIKNTKIVYHYYYTSKLKDFSKYDKKLIQYHPTTYLYELLIIQINNLSSKELNYFEDKDQYALIADSTDEVFYNNFKKIPKKKKNAIKIYLGPPTD